MTPYALNILFNHSITIGAAIAVARFRTASAVYKPFLWLLVIGFCNETISLIMMYSVRNNMVNSNIYLLLEFFLVLLQFHRWDTFHTRWLTGFAGCGFIVWFADHFILHHLADNTSIFRVFYSLNIVVLSLVAVSQYEANHSVRVPLPMLLICFAFLLYYTCKSFIEVFNAYTLDFRAGFYHRLFFLLDCINLLTNLVYATAVLCLPKKSKSFMQ